MKKVSIFGLGYVGCVNLACLADSGHQVIGIDILHEKVNLINSGLPTIVEKDVEKLIQKNKRSISATTDINSAIQNTDISLICVGTPSGKEGQLDLSHIFKISEDIGKALREKKNYHVVAIRSTVAPGTNREVANLIENVSGKTSGKDFTVISNPEFLREGTAVKDYFEPQVTVLGGESSSEGIAIIKDLYSDISAPIKVVSSESAELIKYLNNSWHALKIVFANECANICKKLEVDAFEVMDLFCSDTKLNLSSAYLKPGFAYGGHCLSKDLKGLLAFAKIHEISTPVLSSIELSNKQHITHTANWIFSKEKKNILFFGLGFKEGTDDIRLSPKIELVKELIARGCKVHLYDIHIQRSIQKRINHEFIKNELEDLTDLFISDPYSVLNEIDLVVLANQEKEYLEIISKLPSNKIILELVKSNLKRKNVNGLFWNQRLQKRFHSKALIKES